MVRSEDEIIAYTWGRYLDKKCNGQDCMDWLLNLQMTKVITNAQWSKKGQNKKGQKWPFLVKKCSKLPFFGVFLVFFGVFLTPWDFGGQEPENRQKHAIQGIF